MELVAAQHPFPQMLPHQSSPYPLRGSSSEQSSAVEYSPQSNMLQEFPILTRTATIAIFKDFIYYFG